MDDIDRSLLVALSDDGRLSYQQLAAQVHLSANSTADRVRRLRHSGVLAGFHAEISLAALGYTLHSLTDVNLRDSVDPHEFERDLVGVPQVISTTLTTGERDYQLRIVSRSTDELQSVLEKLHKLGTRDAESRIVLAETSLGATRLV
ncbi:MAG TPA: Lrp/AsnC family transcriptional regulator [Acidimicrobiales bacterium]